MSDRPENKSGEVTGGSHEVGDPGQTQESSIPPEVATGKLGPARETKAEGVASVPRPKRRLKITKGPKRRPKVDPQSADSDEAGTAATLAASPAAGDPPATEPDIPESDTPEPDSPESESPESETAVLEVPPPERPEPLDRGPQEPERSDDTDSADEEVTVAQVEIEPLEEASGEAPPPAPEASGGPAEDSLVEPEEDEVRASAEEESYEQAPGEPESAEQTETSGHFAPYQPSPAVAAPPLGMTEDPKETDDSTTEDEDGGRKVPRPRRTVAAATPMPDPGPPSRARPSPRLIVLVLLLVIIAVVWWLWPTSMPPEEASPDGSELSREEFQEIEQLLGDLAIDPGPIDGVVDAQTQEAIRFYQESGGLPVDGEPTAALLNDLREVAAGL